MAIVVGQILGLPSMTRFTFICTAIVALIGISGFRPQGKHVPKTRMNRLESSGNHAQDDRVNIGFLVADSGALSRQYSRIAPNPMPSSWKLSSLAIISAEIQNIRNPVRQ